jgi:hypothetical protein
MTNNFQTKWDEYKTLYNIKETPQSTHTHIARVHKKGSSRYDTTAKLDRFYVTANQANNSLHTPTSYIPTIPHLATRRGGPSDHLAVSLIFHNSKITHKTIRNPTIPPWVASSEIFEKKVRAEHDKYMRYANNPWINLEKLKKIMHTTTKRIIKKHTIRARTQAGKVQATIATLRQLTKNNIDFNKLDKLVTTYPHLRKTLNLGEWNQEEAYNLSTTHTNI